MHDARTAYWLLPGFWLGTITSVLGESLSKAGKLSWRTKQRLQLTAKAQQASGGYKPMLYCHLVCYATN